MNEKNKLFYWIKKESTNNNYNGLRGFRTGGPSKPIGVFAKPVPNREFERDKPNVTSLLETFYKQYLLDKKKNNQ